MSSARMAMMTNAVSSVKTEVVRTMLSMGASIIPRGQFTDMLNVLCEPAEPFRNWPQNPIKVPELLEA